MKTTWWIDSGAAAEAARGLTWFVVLVFLGIGVVLWMDYKNDK